MYNYLWVVIQGGPENKSLAIVHGCLPKRDAKTLMLKPPYTLVVWYREIKRYCKSCWGKKASMTLSICEPSEL